MDNIVQRLILLITAIIMASFLTIPYFFYALNYIQKKVDLPYSWLSVSFCSFIGITFIFVFLFNTFLFSFATED